MATHSSTLAWRIPGTGKPDGPAAYGVAQSRKRLKRLSSSSNKNTDSKKYFSLNEVFKIGQSHSFRNNLF